MKKTLVLLVSLLSVSCVAGFTGCKDSGNDSNKAHGNVQTKIVTLEDENGDKCPDCEERGMPKVHFDFKNGRPACMGDRDGIEPPHGKHGRPPHPPKRPTPVPPEDGGQDKNEN